ncbi:hypothetical protein GF325_01440, partial [Candidatus Bathyarchaeota archaeon]|nr:hypothetical protein [Candidatus Bathyarchaeota archaeon]
MKRRKGFSAAMVGGMVALCIILGHVSVPFLHVSRDRGDIYLPGGDIRANAGDHATTLPGTSQDVRYIGNRTVQVGNTAATSNLTVPAMSSDSTLFEANGSFKFNQASFDVNHTIENSPGFNTPHQISGWKEPVNLSSSSILTGTENASFPYTNLNNPGDPWIIASSGNQVIVTFGFEIGNISFPSAIRNDLELTMQFDRNVTIDVEGYDYRNGGGWQSLNGSAIPYEKDIFHFDIIRLINDHAQYLSDDPSTVLNLTVVISATGAFNARLHGVRAQAYGARSVQISADKQLALSFDLRGDATVDGVWLWIRSLNLSSSEVLQMQVYESDNSSITIGDPGESIEGIRSTGNTEPYQEPDLGAPVPGSTITINDYTGDELAYFQFSSGLDLDIGNYFLVLESDLNKTLVNISTSRYSVMVLPWDDQIDEGSLLDADDPEKVNDHTFLFSNDTGTTWHKVYAKAGNIGEVDAAPFNVTITRRLIPSDLDMIFGDVSVNDVSMAVDQPFSINNFEWGLGNWTPSGQSYIASGANYEIGMDWDTGRMADFTYNASIDMLAYSNEPADVTCTLDPGEAPAWLLNFTFERDLIASWTGRRFNFTYPADWNVVNLTYPDGKSYFDATNESSISGAFKQYSVTEVSINELPAPQQEGNYKFRFTSQNYLNSLETYLFYKSKYFYKTKSFTVEDNLSARIHVRDSNGLPVDTGMVNVTMFSPTDTVFLSDTSTVINNTLNFTASYHFEDTILHQWTSGNANGTYKTRGFWFNGSEAGIMISDVFKVGYSIMSIETIENYDRGVNTIRGHFATGLVDGIKTQISTISITEEKSPVDILVDLPIDDIRFHEFNQSETIYNPGETVDFSLNVSVMDPMFSHELEACVEIFQFNQPGRVIMNLTMAPVTLASYLEPGYMQVLNFSGTFPAGTEGFNAPVRNGLYMTRVKFFIDGDLAETWESSETMATKVDDGALDGSIIAVKTLSNRTGVTFSQEFNRTTETIFNNRTVYLMLLESQDGVSMDGDYWVHWTNNISAIMEGINIRALDGELLAINNKINISGTLLLENGTYYTDAASVESWIMVEGMWLPFNTTTGSNIISVLNGNVTAIFQLPSTYQETVPIKLNWSGVPAESIRGLTYEHDLDLIRYVANYTMTILAGEVEIFGNLKNFYNFRVTNTGNTTLAFNATPVMTSSQDVHAQVSAWANDDLFNVLPGESFIFELNILHDDLGLGKSLPVNFTVNLNAYSIETKEYVDFPSQFNGMVKSVSLIDRMGDIWYVFYIGLIVGLLYLAFLYIRHVRKRIKKPVEEGALARKKSMEGVQEPEGKKLIVKKGSEIEKEAKFDEKEPEKAKYRDIDDVI